MQIDSTQARIFKVIESTLQLSNLDLVASYAFKEKSAPMPATSNVQNNIIGPALSDAQVSAWLLGVQHLCCSWISKLTPLCACKLYMLP